MTQPSDPALIDTRVSQLLKIRYPIIQGGMIYCAGSELAGAVSNAGGLGLIGAGSMTPDLFEHHIKKTRTLTDKPFGVNLPLTYRHMAECIEITLKQGVKVVFVSAGSPKKCTDLFKSEGCTVVHVTSTPELALKCQNAGVDAVVAEGTEAGGHNGRDEITTFCLIPQTADRLDIPVIAAGGIADGRGMAAALALGAEGVQVGSRFAITRESSAHTAYKEQAVEATADGTKLLFKKLIPTRMLMNEFARRVSDAENRGASEEELKALLSTGRARKGIFEGDIQEGELEIGQCAAMMKEIPSAEQVVRDMARLAGQILGCDSAPGQ